MSFQSWFESPRIRRAIALSAVVLSTGGLILYRAPASAFPTTKVTSGPLPLVAGKNSATFSGPGAHGMVSLSHSLVHASTETRVYADVRLVADRDLRDVARERAPISLAVVLDTSGSMSGEKIEEARRSVLRLVDEMRDDDEIALVRYSDSSEVLQPLARVGNVRSALKNRIRALEANGGTNIPSGLSQGRRALDEAQRGRVKRIVLVSDGLDSTRAQAENLARQSFASGITISSLGIGLDFDESYMGSVAQNGHGNFAFVKDGAALASFLQRELEEAASTTIENARVTLRLERGLRFVSATGADATPRGRDVELAVGSLFAGDERRIIVELAADGGSREMGASTAFETVASWNVVGGELATAHAPRLTLLASADASEVADKQDGAVMASVTSVLASSRQLKAQAAYTRGDTAEAARLTEESQRALSDAIAKAPPAAAPSLRAQAQAYGEMKKGFATIAPSSAEGRAAAKSAAADEMQNLGRVKR